MLFFVMALCSAVNVSIWISLLTHDLLTVWLLRYLSPLDVCDSLYEYINLFPYVDKKLIKIHHLLCEHF